LARQLFEFAISPAEYVHDARIETAAALSAHPFHGFVERQRAPVLPVRSERVQAVDGGNDSRPDWYLVSAKAIWITCAVPFFVMRADYRGDGVWELNALEDLRADDRVDFHLLEFFRCETTGLRDDVLGDGEFADVVQQRRSVQRLPF